MEVSGDPSHRKRERSPVSASFLKSVLRPRRPRASSASQRHPAPPRRRAAPFARGPTPLSVDRSRGHPQRTCCKRSLSPSVTFLKGSPSPHPCFPEGHLWRPQRRRDLTPSASQHRKGSPLGVHTFAKGRPSRVRPFIKGHPLSASILSVPVSAQLFWVYLPRRPPAGRCLSSSSRGQPSSVFLGSSLSASILSRKIKPLSASSLSRGHPSQRPLRRSPLSSTLS
ncbi:hypothetical protein AVEN_136173-1 [Araneus ventricosus]|uniref:Uncharacterized protein n=1 Tax=Araneus ventricosus TaxID=182803 RepID=A0A4Y2UY56_ARAVE|nr:hypothetical protein AVEN_136173-1 [Araneus ventricosus]